MTDQPAPRGGAMSDEQLAFLLGSGAFTKERLAAVSARVARGDLEARERASRQGAIDASLSPDQVAERLGISVSEAHRRRAALQLYAFTDGGEEFYPAWQFTDDEDRPVLPGLPVVLAAFSADMHAATIRGFMNTPQRSARIDGAPVTPVEWLMQGGNPRHLAGILEGFLLS